MTIEKKQDRRAFLAGTAGIMAGFSARMVFGSEKKSKKVKIVLRSSWQMVNIGDIAHTAGVIALLEKYIPEAEVTLWPSQSYLPEVGAMEQARFPKLRIMKGSISPDGKRVNNPDLARALDQCDFILHGSGPSFVAARDIDAAVKRTGKPFGIYCITWAGENGTNGDLMDRSQFIFFRDTVSLAAAKKAGISSPVMEFGPDGAFAFDIVNEKKADLYLKSCGLEPGKFACVIPRYRFTPYWNIHNRKMTDKDIWKAEVNKKLKEHDHKPIRDAVIETVRNLGLKVLLCPEDQSQMAIGREMIYDKLPEDVKKKVVWRPDYWITDEAVAVYRRSVGLFGLEMHSPIMCIGNGIPALVGRFKQQTSKGIMWKDIGLDDWLFDLDQEEEIPKIVPAVLKMLSDKDYAMENVRKAQKIVHQRQQASMNVLRKSLGLDS